MKRAKMDDIENCSMKPLGKPEEKKNTNKAMKENEEEINKYMEK